MRVAELILEYLGTILTTLAWPVLARQELVELMRRLAKAKFPGGTELDFLVSEVTQKASAEIPSLPKEEISRARRRPSLLERVQDDPELGLAALRVELERALRALLVAGAPADGQLRRQSLGQMVRTLEQRGDIPSDVGLSLREVISLANRAVHGESVSREAAETLAELGVRLLELIREVYDLKITEPKGASAISSTDRDRLAAAQYKVTTVVPLVDEPYTNVRIVDQEGLDAFLDGYETFGEFLVRVEPVDVELPTEVDTA